MRTCAPRERSASVSAAAAVAVNARSAPSGRARRADRGRRDEAEHARPAAGGRGVEVRRAPDAAVDVLAVADLAPARTGPAPHRRRARPAARWPAARRARRRPRAGRCAGRPRRPAAGRRSARRATRGGARAPTACGRPRGSALSAAARIARPAGAVPAIATGASGLATATPARPAALAARAEHAPGGLRLGRRRAPRAGGPVAGLRAAARGERGGDDRAGRGADEVLAAAEVELRGRLDAASSPRIHASPSVPPTPSTSTSGRSFTKRDDTSCRSRAPGGAPCRHARRTMRIRITCVALSPGSRTRTRAAIGVARRTRRRP